MQCPKAQRHQWKPGRQADDRPFAARDAKFTRGNDIRDIARDQHSSTDQQAHQDTTLLRRGQPRTDFGCRQGRVIDYRRDRVEPEQDGVGKSIDVLRD